MSISNRIENALLIVGSAIITAALFMLVFTFVVKPSYQAQIANLTKQVEINNRLIQQLANEPKYKIENDFGKMKPKDGSVIQLDLDNKLEAVDSRTSSITTVSGDTTAIKPVKRSFWDKVFGRNKQ